MKLESAGQPPSGDGIVALHTCSLLVPYSLPVLWMHRPGQVFFGFLEHLFWVFFPSRLCHLL